MDRLTYRHDDKWCISGINGKLISDKHANYWGEAIDRLATYENAGIEPCDYAVVRASYEEAERAKKDLSVAINKLGECMKLLKAEEQGRLVILPCSVGDSYFTYSWGCHGLHDDCLEQDDCDKCPHLKVDIRECKFKNAAHILNAEEEFGKTIFLTREEAEAALRGECIND